MNYEFQTCWLKVQIIYLQRSKVSAQLFQQHSQQSSLLQRFNSSSCPPMFRQHGTVRTYIGCHFSWGLQNLDGSKYFIPQFGSVYLKLFINSKCLVTNCSCSHIIKFFCSLWYIDSPQKLYCALYSHFNFMFCLALNCSCYFSTIQHLTTYSSQVD